jgi:hypothetical protein
MLAGSGGSGGSNECNRVAHSRTKKYPALWRPYFWNQPRITNWKDGRSGRSPFPDIFIEGHKIIRTPTLKKVGATPEYKNVISSDINSDSLSFG